MYFGDVGGKFAIVGPLKKIRHVGDFTVSQQQSYPVINVGGKMVMVHRAVAYAYGKITKDEFDRSSKYVAVMHLNNNKHDFHPDNLKFGTTAENILAVHDNAATTRRKRVRQLDVHRSVVAEYPSTLAAVAAVDRAYPQGICRAIAKRCKFAGFYWEFARPLVQSL